MRSIAKGLVPSLVFCLLCHCSTKHQPVVLTPYFAFATEDVDVGRRVIEIDRLESSPSLSLWEKKRLWDLYSAEVRRLKPNSPRLALVKGRLEVLQQDVEPLEAETQRLVMEFLSARPSLSADVFETEGLKRKYLEILKVWSRDENDLAFEKANELLTSDVTKAERLKLLSVAFRIAYDIGREAEIFQAHDKLVDLEKCASETASAGFLRSIYLLGKEKAAEARAIFHAQCDPDESLSNRIRRAYWWYRFQEKGSPAAENAYGELLKLPLSGYYLYLAKASRGEEMTVALPAAEPAFLSLPLSVSKEVHEAWTAAEAKIQANLRRDASLSLHQAAASLRGDLEDNVLPLLYTARLFQAAGNHLEAMKIYSDLIGSTKEDVLVNEEFMRAFPRPFPARVSWMAKEWSVDPDFVYSLMRQESAFNPGAVSSADARGLMQMMPSLAKSLSKQWGYKPLSDDKFLFRGEENLKLSIFHLHQLQAKLPHPALVAGAYNAGLMRTSNWWRRFGEKPLDIFVEEIPVNETRNYIKLVLRNLIYYKAWRNHGKVPSNLFPLQLPPAAMVVSTDQVP